MNNITKPSRRFALLLHIIFYVYPIFILWLWVDPSGTASSLGFDLIKSIMGETQIRETVLWQRLACFGAAMLTGSVVMYMLHSLSRLFTLYGKGEFFSTQNVACYRAVGISLIVQQAVSLPEQALQTVILSWTNPVGQRIIAIGADDTNISLIVVGLMVIVISRIMDEGRKMQEEQQLTV
ncbi:DUF2975 domain-containing protein [Pseudodesulfovibrio sediminis]|uniref:DUF2975 domain-containing protein n=1 Tax=Pseudodesulfovibrio sediminis TaxID=2810563 RepID=A0ABM7P670_9BACT|nr:DUF2975 domain-containing protein [Pseudodesulfovibrio sediminis]BCS89068.1 hypothetical protein PSDVSF_23100 [Pseudodesulfovibrio sediminis]